MLRNKWLGYPKYLCSPFAPIKRPIAACLRISKSALNALKVLKGHGSITEVNVGDTLKEVRKALLDADVDSKTAKNFVKTVKEQALGREVLTSIQPGQLLIKITHEELPS